MARTRGGMAHSRRIRVVPHAAADKTAGNTGNDDTTDGLPSVNFEPIAKRWASQDLQILRSGLFADAEIVCQGDATPRKVHRTILAGRSAWFKKAFFGNFEEAEERKINLREAPWRVDLMLYFLYTGGIDVNDETLTSGHDPMNISIELIRLGDFYQSTDMSIHGNELLRRHLDWMISEICLDDDNLQTAEAAFREKTDFPQQFCNAVVNAFDTDRPVKPAQKILADFAIAARIHLFKNKEFKCLITDKSVPDFGNLVLAALLDGSASGEFDSRNMFRQC